jgi:hypothetical protein
MFSTRFEKRKYLMNLMEFLPKRLQNITDVDAIYIKY